METIAANGSEGAAQFSGNGGDANLPQTSSGAAVTANRISHSTADKLHRAASALRERTEGHEGRVTKFAGNAATAMDSAANYVDSASLTTVKNDLGNVVRRYPLPSLAVGLGVGFFAARLIRR